MPKFKIQTVQSVYRVYFMEFEDKEAVEKYKFGTPGTKKFDEISFEDEKVIGIIPLDAQSSTPKLETEGAREVEK